MDAKTPGEEGKPTTYRTGHVPAESIEAFMARIRSNQTFVEDQTTEHRQPKKRVKMWSKIAKLSDAQKRLLAGLLSGTRWLVQCGGRPYACRRTDYGFELCGLDADDTPHSVNVDGTVCSCPQNAKLHKVCKHMEAVRRCLGTQT